MAWQDNLRPASFRGVAFHVESHEAQGGRRAVTHEFPGRNKPYTEDMGRHAQTFTIDAYVIGDDYFDARDALITACDGDGEADLVHPYLGTISAVCSGWTLRETKTDGRMARFSLTFVEAGESQFPSDSTDVVALAGDAADSAKGFSIESFGDLFDIDGLPDFALDDAEAMLTSATSQIISIAKGITGLASGQFGFLGTVNLFAASIGSLMRTPNVLASQFYGLMNSLGSLFDSPREGAVALSSFAGFTGDQKPILVTTATREQQQVNRNAVVALVRQSAVVEAARIAPIPTYQVSSTSPAGVTTTATVPTYETEQDAEQVRDSLTAQVDDISEDPTTTDDVFTSLQDVRTAVVKGVPPPNVALPNLVTYTPIKTLPALVLAYDLYEDANRDTEIVSRNDIAYPGFVPGAEPLRVLTND
ncbi:DNA circularization protein [Bradyrhizobium sp.]|uniref:DNA circularization protein n=1 Tax=Bradyrhizobium sp. TaxID=376 RepID=UPI0039E2C5C7